MKCKNCNEKEAVKYSKSSNGKFCSRECARGFSTKAKRKEINKKVSEKLKGRFCTGITYYTHICKICGVEFRRIKRKQYTCGKKECVSKYLSKKLKEVGAGGYRGGSKKYKRKWHESPIAGRVFLDSSYEVRYAKYLDKNNIKWEKNTKKFPYIFENKEHNYIPDFYLDETNEYIETKGYETEQDRAKWLGFPHKLTILFGKDLEKIESIN